MLSLHVSNSPKKQSWKLKFVIKKFWKETQEMVRAFASGKEEIYG